MPYCQHRLGRRWEIRASWVLAQQGAFREGRICRRWLTLGPGLPTGCQESARVPCASVSAGFFFWDHACQPKGQCWYASSSLHAVISCWVQAGGTQWLRGPRSQPPSAVEAGPPCALRSPGGGAGKAGGRRVCRRTSTGSLT